MRLAEHLTRDLVISEHVAADSPVRALAIPRDYLLVRPYSPKGKTKGGLWLERNPRHAKIWGWVLAIPAALLAQYPSLAPGNQIVMNRWSYEPIEKEKPARQRYFGHHYVVLAMTVDDVHCAISPALVPMEAA